MRIRAVAFDVDGTLYPNSQMFLHSLPPFFSHPRLFIAFARARSSVRAAADSRRHVEIQAERVAAALRIGPAEAQERIESHLYRGWERSYRGIRPFPDVRKALEELRATGISLAALSDFPIGRKLEYLGLEDLVKTAFCSEETGFLKPHPAPFEALAERLETHPDEILYVGNSYEKDIVGALSAGMHAAWVTRVWESSRGDTPIRRLDMTESLSSDSSLVFKFRSYGDFVSRIAGIQGVSLGAGKSSK
jgi:putative hydrolase of the HAD superfamily